MTDREMVESMWGCVGLAGVALALAGGLGVVVWIWRHAL